MSIPQLTVAQKEAIDYINGNLLIIAGAGSGKTSTLTYRIANMLNNGIKPWQILAVTFTNKAAKEMLNRVKISCHEHEQTPTMGTFHSICFKILQNEINHLNYQPNFTIYDTKEQESLIKTILKSDNENKNLDAKSILRHISKCKNQLITVQQYRLKADNNYQTEIAFFYGEYQKLLHQNNALDFDDLIMLTVLLFKNNPDVLVKYQKKWLYILVDEYQDTNEAQYQLVKLLSQTNNNLCVVGDFDQSIYAFRGAIITKILEFAHEFPQVKVIKLEQNFRSTQHILNAANALIENNKQRLDKTLITANNEGDKIKIWEISNQYEEANKIVKEIFNLYKYQNISLNNNVILYRTNAQSRSFEEAFLTNGIAYKIVGGLRFYERKEIKDVLAYLRILLNPNDTVSLLRIINVPARKLGESTLNKLQNFALNRNMHLFEVLNHVLMVDNLAPNAKKALIDFMNLYQDLKKDQLELPLSELVSSVLQKSGYNKMIADNSIENIARQENLIEFKSVACKFDQFNDLSLAYFLEEVALVQDADSVAEQNEAVTLMTIHTAKGLEFDNVFVVGLEESIFPHERSLYNPNDIEEERRLMYVAMTRAKKRLYLSHCMSRETYGSYKKNAPSRFLGEIPGNLVEINNNYNGTKKEKTATWADKEIYYVKDEDTQQEVCKNYEEGMMVEHANFGKGQIIAIEKDYLHISFGTGQVKKFMIEITPLRII